MCILALLWIVLGIICWIIGLNVLYFTKSTAMIRLGDRAILAIWLGLSLLCILSLTLSLVFPLSPLLGILISLTLLAISLQNYSIRQEIFNTLKHASKYHLFLFLILLILGSFFTARSVYWYDTGLYHFQSVEWFSQFGTVPGLALLNSRFGSNSSWFALSAFFNTGILQGRISSLLGGFVFTLALGHFTLNLLRIFQKRDDFIDWFLALAYLISLAILFWWRIQVSLAPDLPVTLLTIVFTWMMIKITQNPNPMAHNFWYSEKLIPLILAAGAFTIRLSALPLVIVTLFFFSYSNSFDWKKFIQASFITLFLTFPLLLFNVITSGCPLYPSTILCLDFLSWSVGSEHAIIEASRILNWAKWQHNMPDNPTQWQWFIYWMNSQSQTFIFTVCSSLFILLLFYKCSNKFKASRNWILMLGAIGILMMLNSAPALRFGLGYLVILPAFGLAIYRIQEYRLQILIIPLIAIVTNGWLSLSATLIFLLIILILVCLMFWREFKLVENRPLFWGFCLFFALFIPLKEEISNPPQNFYFLLPPPLENLNKAPFLSHQVNDIFYITPDTRYEYEESPGFIRTEEQCWAEPLPCTNALTHPDIQLRNPQLGLRGGFIRNSLLKPNQL